MSRSNPTALKVGMTGEIDGRRYTILGRVLMGMEEGGETWYWNEFNLRAEDGSEATLVHEETESGADWKFFRYFEPAGPISNLDAERLRPGNRVNVDGLDAHVDLVGQAIVHDIEGQAPDGVTERQLSSYFNASANGRMLVVSWRAGEVEHYIGDPLSRADIEIAFGVRQPLATQRSEVTRHFGGSEGVESSGPNFGRLLKIGIIVLIAAVFLVKVMPGSCAWKSSAAARQAPAIVLKQGETLQLPTGEYQVQASSLMEYAQFRETRFCRLYQLTDAEGRPARLILGAASDETEAWLLVQKEPPAPLTPLQAGALRLGSELRLEDCAGKVTALFRTRIISPSTQPLPARPSESLRYGLTARTSQGLWYLDWDESTLRATRCILIPAATLKAALR